MYPLNYLNLLLLSTVLFLAMSCGNHKTEKDSDQKSQLQAGVESAKEVEPEEEPVKSPSDFIPEGFILFEEIKGDLNKDGEEDLVLLIKGTDKSRIVEVEDRGKLDRNRRGILILFKKKRGYELILENRNCFASENEEGGVYYAPELYLEIEKGKLFVKYAHGRYGNWSYTFRFKNNDFDLIGFDESNAMGPVIESEISINFLTKKKQIRRNTNLYEDPENEVFDETWEDIKQDKLIQLSAIKDFEDLSDQYLE